MPYIKPHLRVSMDSGQLPTCPGELNYCITQLIDGYLQRNPRSYMRINEVIGVLECAKLEAYRRIAVPYEDIQHAANGDVYSQENLGL